MGWVRRLRNTILGSNRDDFAEETRFHLDQRTDEYVKSGMNYEEARLGAHHRLGNLALVREQARDVDTFRWLGDLGRERALCVATTAKKSRIRSCGRPDVGLGDRYDDGGGLQRRRCRGSSPAVVCRLKPAGHHR